MAMLMSKLSRKGGPAVLALRWTQAAVQVIAAALLPAGAAKAAPCDIVNVDPITGQANALTWATWGCNIDMQGGEVTTTWDQYCKPIYRTQLPGQTIEWCKEVSYVWTGDDPLGQLDCYVCKKDTECTGYGSSSCPHDRNQRFKVQADYYTYNGSGNRCWWPHTFYDANQGKWICPGPARSQCCSCF